MKKEKKIRTYQRRTKSGKLVTVKAHTAKYDAAEHARELAKRKGAGDELEERKKKSSAQLELPFAKGEEDAVLEEVKETTAETTKRKAKAKEPKTSEPKPKAKSKTKEAKPTTSEPAFTAAEFKEWYRGTGSAADKRVAKALRAQLGRAGYKKLEDEAIDNYSARGHLSMFKRVSSGGGVTASPKSSGFNNEVSFSRNFPKELRKFLDPKNHSLAKKPTKAVEAAFKKAGFGITYNSVEGLWEPTMGGRVYGEVDYAAKIKAERSKKPEVVRWAKENGYVVSRDGTYHLRADSRKSSYDVYTLSEMEKIMKAKSKEGKGVNVGKGKPKSKKTEPDPLEEHVKSQVAALKHLERTIARLEESLRTAKSVHSKLWTNDPKRMRYAKRIQNLQQKLADTKEALGHQRQIVEDVTKPSKTSGSTAPKSAKPESTPKAKASFAKELKRSAANEREAERRLSKSADAHLAALRKSLSKEQVNRLKEVGLTPTTFAEKFGGSYSDGKFTRTKRTQKGTRFTHKPVTKSFDAWIDLYEKTGSFELGGPIKKVPKSEATARKSKPKKSYTTAKRMKPSEVAEATTKRDWIYEG